MNSVALYKFSDLPIIMLTAVDEEETIIQGIQYFAEDYVTKPFSPRELVVRVQRRRLWPLDEELGLLFREQSIDYSF